MFFYTFAVVIKLLIIKLPDDCTLVTELRDVRAFLNLYL